MRDIRARIAERHGIDLTTQQIHELAARRLEAILDPRNVSPGLLDQLRKAAGTPARDLAAEATEPAYSFEEGTLYESPRGLLRSIRALLNPVLRLFFNPNPLIRALNIQTRLNAEHAAREAERDRRQAEWNALHYELIQRVVTESARLSIELQTLALRVEALAGRVDYADRRVRVLEAAPAPRHQRPQPHHEAVTASVSAPSAASSVVQTAVGDVVPGVQGAASGLGGETSSDGPRRRRRRRRGRRSGGGLGEAGTLPAAEGGEGREQLADEFDDTGSDDGGETSAEAPALDTGAAADTSAVEEAPVAQAPAGDPGSEPT